MDLARFSQPFPELLRQHLTAAGMNVSQLARESGLPRRTIANWLEGYAHKPRYWNDVLKLAAALHLDRPTTDELLFSAGFPTTATLRARYPDHMLPLLWNGAVVADSVGRRVIEIIGESGGALFQELPLVKAVYLLEQTITLAETLGESQYACPLMLDLARCLMVLGRYQAAAETLYKAIVLAERDQQPELELESRSLLISVQTFARLELSDLDNQRRILQAALHKPLSLQMRLRAWQSLGLWATHVQRYDEASHYYQQIYDFADGSYLCLSALNNLGDLAIRRQDYVAADRLLGQALQLSAGPGSDYAITYVRSNRGLVKMRTGDYETAEIKFDLGTQLAVNSEDQRGLLMLHLNRAELALHRCDEPRAAEEFRAALRLCDEETFSDVKPLLSYCFDRLQKGHGKHLITDPYYRASLDNLV